MHRLGHSNCCWKTDQCPRRPFYPNFWVPAPLHRAGEKDALARCCDSLDAGDLPETAPPKGTPHRRQTQVASCLQRNTGLGFRLRTIQVRWYPSWLDYPESSRSDRPFSLLLRLQPLGLPPFPGGVCYPNLCEKRRFFDPRRIANIEHLFRNPDEHAFPIVQRLQEARRANGHDLVARHRAAGAVRAWQEAANAANAAGLIASSCRYQG